MKNEIDVDNEFEGVKDNPAYYNSNKDFTTLKAMADFIIRKEFNSIEFQEGRFMN